MSDTLSFKCPEDGCPIDASGVNDEELTEIILVHKKVKHRKSFEYTHLGMLPPEIMLMILGYVVPDCKNCFLQRDLLRLGSVCKRLNKLTKTADLYKDIRLTDECCPLPTVSTFAAIIENCGAKLARIRCNYKSKDLLSVALQRCGDVIEEIQVGNMNVWSSLHVPSKILLDIKKWNPKSLNLIKFRNITFKINKKTKKELFYSRIYGLNIDWTDDTPQDCEDRNARNARKGICAGFPIHALRSIQSLQQVNVKLHTNDSSATKARIKESMLDNLRVDYASIPPLNNYKLSYKEEAGQLEINVERSTEHPPFETKPEVSSLIRCDLVFEFLVHFFCHRNQKVNQD